MRRDDLDALLPPGPRLAVLGSTDFWHADSERTCTEIGRLLAGIPGLVLLTGGVEGIGEAVGASFFQTRRDAGQEPLVFHVLPEGEPSWDYGETLIAGADMTERREILGRLSGVFVMVEGGPRRTRSRGGLRERRRYYPGRPVRWLCGHTLCADEPSAGDRRRDLDGTWSEGIHAGGNGSGSTPCRASLSASGRLTCGGQISQSYSSRSGYGTAYRYISKNGTGSKKACCWYRLAMPSQAAYCVKKTMITYSSTVGTIARRPVQRKNQ